MKDIELEKIWNEISELRMKLDRINALISGDVHSDPPKPGVLPILHAHRIVIHGDPSTQEIGLKAQQLKNCDDIAELKNSKKTLVAVIVSLLALGGAMWALIEMVSKP